MAAAGQAPEPTQVAPTSPEPLVRLCELDDQLLDVEDRLRELDRRVGDLERLEAGAADRRLPRLCREDHAVAAGELLVDFPDLERLPDGYAIRKRRAT